MQKPRKKLRLAGVIMAAVLGVLITATASPKKIHLSLLPASPSPVSSVAYNSIAWSLAKMEVYDSLHLDEFGLSRSVFQMALKGMDKLRRSGQVRENILSIVDFSKPSSEKRLFVIDLNNYQMLFHSLVAHGNRSGKETANVFSNRPKSNASSLGFYITGQTYRGSNGYSLKLKGMEKGINDAAYRRAIVVHGANYVSDSWIDMQGYIGRSQGCPAVPMDISKPLIDEIKDGTVLFIYHPTSTYLSRSKLVR